MRRFFIPIILAVAVCLCASSSDVGALTGVPMSLEELVASSEDIVHGTVTSVSSHWNDDRTLILTDVRVQVHESIKGEAGPEFVFQHPGGVVGALRIEVPGAGTFRPDEEAVLFLTRDIKGDRWVTGIVQGRVDVRTDKKGVPVVGTSTSREHTANSTAGSERQAGTETLGAFLDKVRSQVSASVDDGGQDQ